MDVLTFFPMVATITLGAEGFRVGADFVECAAGPYRTRGGVSVNGGEEKPVLSSLCCSDTSDAIIRAARREGARVSLWTQAL